MPDPEAPPAALQALGAQGPGAARSPRRSLRPRRGPLQAGRRARARHRRVRLRARPGRRRQQGGRRVARHLRVPARARRREAHALPVGGRQGDKEASSCLNMLLADSTRRALVLLHADAEGWEHGRPARLPRRTLGVRRAELPAEASPSAHHHPAVHTAARRAVCERASTPEASAEAPADSAAPAKAEAANLTRSAAQGARAANGDTAAASTRRSAGCHRPRIPSPAPPPDCQAADLGSRGAHGVAARDGATRTARAARVAPAARTAPAARAGPATAGRARSTARRRNGATRTTRACRAGRTAVRTGPGAGVATTHHEQAAILEGDYPFVQKRSRSATECEKRSNGCNGPSISHAANLTMWEPKGPTPDCSQPGIDRCPAWPLYEPRSHGFAHRARAHISSSRPLSHRGDAGHPVESGRPGPSSPRIQSPRVQRQSC
jgi:hypothetical protein